MKGTAGAVAQAFAYLEGATQVEPEHLEVLQHVLWEGPLEQPQKCAQVIARSIPAELVAPFLAWNQHARARLVALVIESPPGDLSLIADEARTVTALSAGEDAVGRALSV